MHKYSAVFEDVYAWMRKVRMIGTAVYGLPGAYISGGICLKMYSTFLRLPLCAVEQSQTHLLRQIMPLASRD